MFIPSDQRQLPNKICVNSDGVISMLTVLDITCIVFKDLKNYKKVFYTQTTTSTYSCRHSCSHGDIDVK